MQFVSHKDLRFILFNRYITIIYILPFLAGYILYYLHSGYTVCPFANLTGLPCPACGLTRSFGELSHLHFREAITYNPFVFPAAVLLLVLIVFRFFPVRMRLRFYKLLLRNLKLLNILFTICILIFVIYGVLRIADHFFNFINFREIVPQRTLLNLLKNMFL